MIFSIHLLYLFKVNSNLKWVFLYDFNFSSSAQMFQLGKAKKVN